jgi:predicted permease
MAGSRYVAPNEPVRVVASTLRRPPLSAGEITGLVGFTVGLSLTILTIAALNIASLSLARLIRRRAELAVRSALGASHRRLVAALVGETVGIAALGGLIGLAIAAAIFTVLRAAADPEMVQMFAVNWRIAPAAVTVTLLAALGGVAWPAIRLGRADLHGALKSARGSWGRGTSAAFRRLIAAEVALTTALCVGAAAFVVAIGQYVRMDRGFEPENVLMVNVITPETEFERAGALQSTLDRLAQVPGVVAVAAGAVPVGGQFTLGGGGGIAPGTRQTGLQTVMPVAGNYFAALGIRLLAGRAITADEALTGTRVAVLSSSMAKAMWPAEGALGRRVYFERDSSASGYEVIGIASEITMPFPRPLPQIYVPYAARAARATSIVARVSGDVGATLRTVQTMLADGRSGVVLRDAAMLSTAVRRGARSQVFFASVLSVLSIIGLAMAAAGLYGVTAFTTSQRTQEFGIRLALGASPRGLLSFTLREAAKPVTGGLILGLAGGAWLTIMLRSQLLGVSALDPTVVLTVTVLVLLVSACAALQPALKVARTDPATPLRVE